MDEKFWTVGRKYMLRTVTNVISGELAELTDHEIILRDAAWIAETVRWAETLETGLLREVEPYPDGLVAVGRGAIVDACVWAHPLPRKRLPEQVKS